MRTVIILNIKTTGNDVIKDDLLQLTILDKSGNELFSEFMRPTKVKEWESSFITPENVKFMRTFGQYKDRIQKIINSSDVIVCYNGENDIAFLKQKKLENLDKKYIFDVMRNYANLGHGELDTKYNKVKWSSLYSCAKHYGFNWEDAKANLYLGDARAVLYCYNKVKKEKFGDKDVD